MIDAVLVPLLLQQCWRTTAPASFSIVVVYHCCCSACAGAILHVCVLAFPTGAAAAGLCKIKMQSCRRNLLPIDLSRYCYSSSCSSPTLTLNANNCRVSPKKGSICGGRTDQPPRCLIQMFMFCSPARSTLLVTYGAVPFFSRNRSSMFSAPHRGDVRRHLPGLYKQQLRRLEQPANWWLAM